MQLNAGCELSFHAQTPTPLILMLRPRSGAGQWIIREEYQITPAVNVTEFTDMYGNLCQRVVAPEGPFSIHFSATVQTADVIDTAPGAPYTPVEDLPDDVLHYTLPSRYCQSDQLGELAAQITKNVEPGYDQAEAIRKWIQESVTYQYGTSDASTSAMDTAASRIGVCRDFTHLGISLCRALNIPARMVVGYLYQLDPMDLHAWFEAYIDGRWFTFDATQAKPLGNRITVAYGRDAADVAFTTQFGAMTLDQMKVWVEAADTDPNESEKKADDAPTLSSSVGSTNQTMN
ncbi:transglutaminase domain-containing protein [Spirosoma fluviale]|uniref:Transglutaminase-like enzyme, putative cysteine protease n=1 Tax=Spirosoma fluviale TaxID=1597977 RepID=A0A286GL11_9BACT|nr:transglutaminase family protein [Spirosoma fluviale]SOD95876.1 Transglutaminase-like enzyme, putative cysteine protease [Spirosoma fluviale]